MRPCLVIAVALLAAWPLALSPPLARAAGLSGRTVVLDAGHGASADGPLTRQVPNGRGGTKDCQTTGTSTNDGYPEHSFTWDVVSRVRDALAQSGATVVLTRTDDTGPAPCVDARAAAANAAGPDAIVSIHGDGGPASGHGFHVNYSAPSVFPAQDVAAARFAPVMRDALVSAGLTPATYIGTNGLYGRADLAGLNLAERPAVLIELGNMRNAGDAAAMTSDQGRAAYAAAVVRGITAYLAG